MSWKELQPGVCASLARNHLVAHVLLAKGAQSPIFEALRFGKQEKRFAVLLPKFSECALN